MGACPDAPVEVRGKLQEVRFLPPIGSRAITGSAKLQALGYYQLGMAGHDCTLIDCKTSSSYLIRIMYFI